MHPTYFRLRGPCKQRLLSVCSPGFSRSSATWSRPLLLIVDPPGRRENLPLGCGRGSGSVGFGEAKDALRREDFGFEPGWRAVGVGTEGRAESGLFAGSFPKDAGALEVRRVRGQLIRRGAAR